MVGETLLAIVTITAGAPVVGLVACGAIAACMMVAVVAEIVAFHTVGSAEADPAIGRHRSSGHRPNQVS